MIHPWDIIGHERELKNLESDIQNNSLHHAYLFVGPENIGKYRTAKSLAGILQCANNFCRKCPTCIQIDKGCQTDTIELANDGESIKIATVRDIIARLSMTPQSNYKILLIDNFGRTTDEASNALLKILEEPTSRTIFIFTANQLRDVMATITSRMRIVKFKKLEDSVLESALKNRFPEATEETVKHVIHLSLGRSGRAIELMSDPEKLQEFKDQYNYISFLEHNAGISTRIMAAQTMAEDRPKMDNFLSLLTHHVRQKMLNTQSSADRMRCATLLSEITRSMSLIDRNVNARLVLENLMIQL